MEGNHAILLDQVTQDAKEFIDGLFFVAPAQAEKVVGQPVFDLTKTGTQNYNMFIHSYHTQEDEYQGFLNSVHQMFPRFNKEILEKLTAVFANHYYCSKQIIMNYFSEEKKEELAKPLKDLSYTYLLQMVEIFHEERKMEALIEQLGNADHHIRKTSALKNFFSPEVIVNMGLTDIVVSYQLIDMIMVQLGLVYGKTTYGADTATHLMHSHYQLGANLAEVLCILYRNIY